MHVDYVIKCLARACGILCRFRKVLLAKIKLLLYNAIFTPHINYCHLVWGTTSLTSISKLLSLQKKKPSVAQQMFRTTLTQVNYSPCSVCFLSYMYETNALLKYKSFLKYNLMYFLRLCNLSKPYEIPYNMRTREIWLVPFSRTNHGQNRLQYRMPT